MLDRVRYYVPYAWHFAVARDAGPLICGVAVTDRCNLACTQCHVSNNGAGDMPYEDVLQVLSSAYDRGCREAYFTGGEPMLWRDGERTIDDLVVDARAMGYFHVHIYTNGTQGLASSADLVWVSVDGLRDTYSKRRGDHFDEVIAAIRERGHPRTAIIYTVDRYTAPGIAPFLRWVHDSHLPVTGVMIYFHTPYYGVDDLFLDARERAREIDLLLALKAQGLPLLNSHAGLLALRSGEWERRMPIALVADAHGESVCCRAGDEVCPDCGYGPCTELWAARQLKPSAIRGMVGYL